LRISRALAAAVLMGTALSGCAFGWGGGVGGGGADTINVLMVNNPQMVDLQKLTKEHFTADTGIEVNYTVLPENDVRDKISQEFSSQAGTYDVASLSNFEIPIYADSGWIAPLDEYIEQTPDFDQDDILGPMAESLEGEDGKIYGEPFYGESSFLMYRKDVLEAEGIEMPEKPTWPEVAEIAAQVDGAQDGMAGICLRGQPGWGQIFGPLTTVVNTFGGTWFTEDWEAQVNGEGFRKATQFYVDLVRQHGERGAAQAGFTECLNNFQQGNAAMWYDATSAAGSLEAGDSPVKGKVGYAPAPVVETDSSGWLYAWSWAIQQGVRGAGRQRAQLGAGPGRQAGVDLREPGLPGGGGGVRRADAGSHRVRRSDGPWRPATPREGHPVRRHPRLPGRRHAGLPAGQLGDRRQDDRRRGAGPRPGAGGGRREDPSRTGSPMSRRPARRTVSLERTRP
jgi:sorbitol/mannitol transport system substrate-binding protein